MLDALFDSPSSGERWQAPLDDWDWRAAAYPGQTFEIPVDEELAAWVGQYGGGLASVERVRRLMRGELGLRCFAVFFGLSALAFDQGVLPMPT